VRQQVAREEWQRWRRWTNWQEEGEAAQAEIATMRERQRRKQRQRQRRRKRQRERQRQWVLGRVGHCTGLSAHSRVLEQVLLCSIRKPIQRIVRRRMICVLEHVVAFGLVPVHRVHGPDGAVARDRVRLAVRGVGAAATRKTRLAKRFGTSLACNIALEPVHVHLLRTRVGIVNPEPRADALAVRAGRHVRGDIEGVIEVPGRIVLDGKDDKVLRLDIVHVGFVGDGQGRTSDVL